MIRHTAHLVSDRSPYFTACGEPFQGWQQPVDADLHGAPHPLPPMDWDKPKRGDKLRQCQACLRVALDTEGDK